MIHSSPSHGEHHVQPSIHIYISHVGTGTKLEHKDLHPSDQIDQHRRCNRCQCRFRRRSGSQIYFLENSSTRGMAILTNPREYQHDHRIFDPQAPKEKAASPFRTADQLSGSWIVSMSLVRLPCLPAQFRFGYLSFHQRARTPLHSPCSSSYTVATEKSPPVCERERLGGIFPAPHQRAPVFNAVCCPDDAYDIKATIPDLKI